MGRNRAEGYSLHTPELCNEASDVPSVGFFFLPAYARRIWRPLSHLFNAGSYFLAFNPEG
jgi:hypothetical protein